MSRLLPTHEIFIDSATDENNLQKFRRVPNTQSESETHQFDEATLLAPAVENMTSKNSGIHSDSTERLSAKARDPEARFMIYER